MQLLEREFLRKRAVVAEVLTEEALMATERLILTGGRTVPTTTKGMCGASKVSCK